MLALALLSQIDFLGDLVLSELNKALTKELDAVLLLDSLSGNPITGFKAKKIILERFEKKLITIDKANINLSFISLIRNSPRVSLLTLTGVKSDYDSLNELLPKTENSSTYDIDIPIDKIELLSTEINSPWGMLRITNSSIRLNNLKLIKIKFNGFLKEKKLSLNGIIKRENENWSFEKTSVNFENGSFYIDGTVYPSPNFNVNTNNLNLESLLSLIPEINSYGIKGFLTGSASVKGKGSDLTANMQGELKNAVIETIPLSDVKINGSYVKGLLDIELKEGHVFKSSLSGRILLDTRQKTHDLELTLSAKNLKFKDWTDKYAKDTKTAPIILSGGLSSIEANIKGPINALVGKVEIAPSNIQYGKLKFNDFYGVVLFDGTPYGTVDFSTIHNGKTTSLKGKYSFAKNTNIKMSLSIPALNIKDLTSFAPTLESYDLAGTATANVFIEGTTGKWLSKAEISIPLLSIKNKNEIKYIRTSSIYNLKSNQFELKSFSAVYNDAEIAGSGTLPVFDEGKEMKLSGTFKNANSAKFYDLVPFFKDMEIKTKLSGTWSTTGSIKNPIISAKVISNGGEFRELKIDKFESNVLFSDNKLVLTPMNIKGYGGSATATTTVNFATLDKHGGATSFSWDVNGNLDDVSIKAITDVLKSEDEIEGNVTATFNVKNGENGPVWKAIIKDGNPKWRDFSAKSLKGTVSGTAAVIKFDKLYAKFLSGNALINGNIKLAAEEASTNDAVLDLKITADNLNLYELLRKHIPAVRGVQGLLEGAIYVSGSPSAPVFSGKATLKPLRFRDFYLPIVNLDFTADYSKIHVIKANVLLKDGSIFGSGKIYKSKDDWETILDIKGDHVDLKQLAAYMPDQIRDRLGGLVSFEIHGDGKLGNFAGKGTITSNKMRVMGINFTDVNAPFYISDGYAVMEDVKTEMNGGTLSGGIALDINQNIWGGNLKALNINIDTTIKQFIPDLEGKVTGKADLKIRGEGGAGRLSTLKGGGVLLMKNGEISEFKAVEAAKKYTSGKPLRFKSIQALFTFDGGYVTILPGSQALAPDGDPVYRYVMLDGSVNRKQEVAMFAMARVNIRALNALLGTLQGVLSAGADLTSNNLDKNELLKNFLGGVLSGYSKTGFSFVTMNINGKVGALEYSNIKVDKDSSKLKSIKNIPRSDSDPAEETVFDGNTKIKLRFEIPVGPGKTDTTENMKDQVVEQTLENLLNNLNFGL